MRSSRPVPSFSRRSCSRSRSALLLAPVGRRGADRHRPVRDAGVRRRPDQHRRARPPAVPGSCATRAPTPSGSCRARSAASRRTSSRSPGTCATRGQANPLAANETCTVVVGFLPEVDRGEDDDADDRHERADVRDRRDHGLRPPPLGATPGRLRRPARRDELGQARRPDHQRGRRAVPAGRRGDLVEPVRQGHRRLRGDDARRGRVVRRRGRRSRRRPAGAKSGFVTIAGHKPHLIALAGVGTEAAAALSPRRRRRGRGPHDVHAAQHGQRGAAVGDARASRRRVRGGADGCSGRVGGAGRDLHGRRRASPPARPAGARRGSSCRSPTSAPVARPRLRPRRRAAGSTPTRSARSRSAPLPLARLVGDGGDNLGAAARPAAATSTATASTT